MKNNFIDSDDNMYLSVYSLVDVNGIITGSNNIILRKVNIKQYDIDKTYLDKDLIENRLYQLIDQFNERKVSHRDFCFAFLTIYIHVMMEMGELARYHFIYSKVCDFLESY